VVACNHYHFYARILTGLYGGFGFGTGRVNHPHKTKKRHFPFSRFERGI
jgi:hypothetical protein